MKLTNSNLGFVLYTTFLFIQLFIFSPSSEEEVVEKEEDFGSPDCHEDATDLICGLIRELSSLKLVNASLFVFYPIYFYPCLLLHHFSGTSLPASSSCSSQS